MTSVEDPAETNPAAAPKAIRDAAGLSLSGLMFAACELPVPIVIVCGASASFSIVAFAPIEAECFAHKCVSRRLSKFAHRG